MFLAVPESILVVIRLSFKAPYYKALLFSSLTDVSSAITSVLTFDL